MRLVAATAAPQLGQYIGQGDCAAILEDHGAEAPHELDGHIFVGHHHHAGQFFEHGMQESRPLGGEALVDGRIRDGDRAHLGHRGQAF